MAAAQPLKVRSVDTSANVGGQWVLKTAPLFGGWKTGSQHYPVGLILQRVAKCSEANMQGRTARASTRHHPMALGRGSVKSGK